MTLIGASQESSTSNAESSTSNADEESSGLSDHLTRDGESTDDERDEKEGDELPPGHDADAVITPLGGQVQCEDYRWRRVKAISAGAAYPEFEFSPQQTSITENTPLNDILWMCMPVSCAKLLETVRAQAGIHLPRTTTQPPALTRALSLTLTFTL